MRRPFRLKPESEEVEKVSSRRRPQCAVPSAAYGAGPEAEALPLAPNAADASAPAPDGASERGAPSGEVWCLLHRVQPAESDIAQSLAALDAEEEKAIYQSLESSGEASHPVPFAESVVNDRAETEGRKRKQGVALPAVQMKLATDPALGLCLPPLQPRI